MVMRAAPGCPGRWRERVRRVSGDCRDCRETRRHDGRAPARRPCRAL